MKAPRAVYERIEKYSKKLEKYPELIRLYKNCYPNTLETTVERMDDGSIFVLTGDIPAMWLRDSTAQVSHYLPLASEDSETREIIKGVIKSQLKFIRIDPYANSFNAQANDHGHIDDLPKKSPWVWECKYEIDSLCYPLRLCYLYWKTTNDSSIFDSDFKNTARIIVDLWKREQNHFENSSYRFTRNNCPWQDTLHNEGKGMPVTYTGMTWSGFRPSDDACVFGYLIPSNMFAVVVLGYLVEIFEAFYNDTGFVCECKMLKEEIEHGIEIYGTYDHPKYGKIYACETDGMGNRRLFDDANVPSLLSIPYLGFAHKNDPMYQRTRKFILSRDNPYFYKGKFGEGIGSPHTPEGHIWHIALSMQGLTADNPDEVRRVIDILSSTHADTGYMHEGFNSDDPTDFSREWFAWSNSLFAELIEYAVDNNII